MRKGYRDSAPKAGEKQLANQRTRSKRIEIININ
jgi:hypothetical protein